MEMSTTTTERPVAERLAGRTLWIPRMTYAGARMMAAVCRSVGIDAAVTPDSDERTLELAGLYLGGEECYPQKVTLGDFLRIIHADDFDPRRTAFFMPTAEGPCRFGQYAPYLRHILGELGYGDVPVISPSSRNSYDGFADHARDMMRRLWWGVIASDILRKLLLKTRPYESSRGDTDEAFERALDMLEEVVEDPHLRGAERRAGMLATLVRIRDRFRSIPARYRRDRPLIGVVGEIFCRLNTFSNRHAVRRIEAHGGEAWLSDVGECFYFDATSSNMDRDLDIFMELAVSYSRRKKRPRRYPPWFP